MFTVYRISRGKAGVFMRKVNVLLNSKRGFYVQDGKNLLFPSKTNNELNLTTGLVRLDVDSLINKGMYSFVKMVNLRSYLPDVYFTKEYHANKGIAKVIHKGVLGGNVFIKECFQDREFIKAFDKEGQVVYTISSSKVSVMNNYAYVKINDFIGLWEDITEEVYSKVCKDLISGKYNIDKENEKVKNVLNPLIQIGVTRIRELSNGLISIKGIHETLVIWGNGDPQMFWFGRHVNFEGKNIKHELLQFVKEGV
ncbi:hypothetical protein D3C71_1316550 [compost metagenome]